MYPEIPKLAIKLLPKGVWAENLSGYHNVQPGDLTEEAYKICDFYAKRRVQYYWDNGINRDFIYADEFTEAARDLSDLYYASNEGD